MSNASCPLHTPADLWVEYYRMELTYVAKLRGRRAVLGIDNGGALPV